MGEEIRERYLPQKGASVFSMVKPSAAIKTLEMVANDLFFLTERFTDDKAVVGMSSFQLMLRVLEFD